MKSKFCSLKAELHVFEELKNKSGVGWDERNKNVTASLTQWTALGAANNNNKPEYKNIGFPLYQVLVLVHLHLPLLLAMPHHHHHHHPFIVISLLLLLIVIVQLHEPWLRYKRGMKKKVAIMKKLNEAATSTKQPYHRRNDEDHPLSHCRTRYHRHYFHHSLYFYLGNDALIGSDLLSVHLPARSDQIIFTIFRNIGTIQKEDELATASALLKIAEFSNSLCYSIGPFP